MYLPLFFLSFSHLGPPLSFLPFNDRKLANDDLIQIILLIAIPCYACLPWLLGILISFRDIIDLEIWCLKRRVVFVQLDQRSIFWE